MTQFFKREVFSLLLGEELISPELVEKIASWRHSGFSVHSKAKASTKEEAERVGKYMVRPLLCPKCGGIMKVIAFITDYSVVDRIISHLKLTFVASKPPPPRIASQELLMAAETSAEYFL
jgi:hypothetical protein